MPSDPPIMNVMLEFVMNVFSNFSDNSLDVRLFPSISKVII